MIRKGTIVTGKPGCLLPAEICNGRTIKIPRIVKGVFGDRWVPVGRGGGKVFVPVSKLVRSEVVICSKDELKCNCSEVNPCCGRVGEYNGYASGPLIFTCPKNCSCHD